MKIAIIKHKNISLSSHRIDPSFHLSDAIRCREDLLNLPFENISIKDVSESVFIGNIFSRTFVKDKDHGMAYLAASDTVLSNINTGKFLSKKQAEKLKYLQLQKDWILITCSGTLGNVTYTNCNFENKIATHDLIRVIPSDKILRKGVLYALLSSKFGYYQLTQSSFGGVVKHINASQVLNVQFPIFPENFQRNIDNLVQQSAILREKASCELSNAIEEITQYIAISGIGDIKNTFSSKSVNISKIYNSLNTRLDPTVYNNNAIDHLNNSKLPYKKLSECDVKIWYPGIFKRAYVKTGIPYIKGSSLFNVNPFRSCDYLSRTRTPMLEQLWLKEGQILMTCAGLCGQVKLITKEYEEKEAIGSPDIIRIQSNDSLFTSQYLFAYLQVPFVVDFMQSLKYGSVIERFDAEHAGTIPIVEPTPELSSKITSIISNYMDCTYKAFKAEEEAIYMVEAEIEKWNKH
jgi:type I restriction enzyme S subunit